MPRRWVVPEGTSMNFQSGYPLSSVKGIYNTFYRQIVKGHEIRLGLYQNFVKTGEFWKKNGGH